MSGKYKITVVGTGYVGMSMAVLLAQHNQVTALDIDAARVDRINQRQSTVADAEIEHYLAEKDLSLTATLVPDAAYEDCDFIIVATPTDYDPETNYFETSAGEYRYIPIGKKHRLTNIGDTELFLLEVQVGSYLGEDDIVRLEDVYGRNKN